MDNPSTVIDRTNPANRVGFWAAILTALLAAVSFGVAATTPPRTGPFAAPGGAIPYPFAATAQFVPRDFVWMYLALLMMLVFLVLAACIHECAADDRKVFGTIGLCLSSVSFTVIAMDYFIQLRTVQPALLRGELDGLAVLSQYNPHGVFIALEELGFLVLGLSFAFLALSLGPSRLERVTRWGIWSPPRWWSWLSWACRGTSASASSTGSR